jgi:hypothetical protein
MPKVKITTNKTWVGGSRAIEGQTYEVTSEEAKVLIANGFAEAVEVKRARNKKGQLKSDDPSTPDVNEAWVGGKKPKKKK